MKRVLLAVCGTVVLAGAAVAIARHAGASDAAAAVSPNAAPAVSLVTAARGLYVVRVDAQGRVGAPQGSETKLAFAGAGVIERIDVHLGQAVRAGTPLAELDPAGLDLELVQARSEVAAARASYAGGAFPARAFTSAQARLRAARDRLRALETGVGGAQSDREAALAAMRQSAARVDADREALNRVTTLFSGGVAALKDVEAARAQLAFDRADADAARAKADSAGANVGASLSQARADVAEAQSGVDAARAQITVTGAQAVSAQARYAAAQRTVALATLRAPAGGVVTAIFKHPGEAVDPTVPALALGPAASNEITLTVSGGDARAVRPGDPVHIRSAEGDADTIGRVRAIVPNVDPATQMSTVVVAGTPRGAVSGDALEATIEVAQRRGIVIPTEAVIEDPQTGKSIVFVRERSADGSEKFVSREITVGASDPARTLVASGLGAGERIAAQGAFDLLAPGGG